MKDAASHDGGPGTASAEMAGRAALTEADANEVVANGARPSAGEVEAVMWAAQLLVAISARSLAAIEAEVSLPQLRVLVIPASQGPQSLQFCTVGGSFMWAMNAVARGYEYVCGRPLELPLTARNS
jgi:hypothetical protein